MRVNNSFMLKIRLFFVIFLIFATADLYAGRGFKQLACDDMRVAIARETGEVKVSGSMVITLPLRREEPIRAGKAVIKADKDGFEINQKVYNISSFSISGDSLRFNGRIYHGTLFFYKEGAGSILVVNHVPLEEYLVGILASEMPLDWPAEALKAQAVSARTYALFQKKAKAESVNGHLFDVEATVQDQVYEGKGRENERAKEAVNATKGEIISRNGRPIKAFFHSTCGGETDTALNVWGDKAEFKAVKDPYCARSKQKSWEFFMQEAGLVSKLSRAGFPAERIESVQIERKKDSPRAAAVVVDTGGQTIFLQGNDFRKIVGYENLRSTWFDAVVSGGNIHFSGHGYGHGVGMCQWGAKGMAEAGKSYRDILRFYYQGTKLTITNNQ